MIAATVLTVLQLQPLCWADRGAARKPAQLAIVAEAIAEASPTPERAAYLIAVGWHESRWCLRVHSAAHRGPGRGLWQLEGKRGKLPGPFVGLSLFETSNAAAVASDVLSRSHQCGSTPAEVFTAYAGRPCGSTWATLNSRVQTYYWALGALHRAGNHEQQ